MTNEIAELLRSVMKEELTPINRRLNNIEQTLTSHNKRFDSMEQKFKRPKRRTTNTTKKIIQSLGDFTEKIVEYVDNKSEALNKRMFTIETEIQRLSRS